MVSLRHLLLAAAMFALLSFARAGYAHTAGVSAGKYVAEAKSLKVTWNFAAREIMALPTLDADGDGTLSPREIASGKRALESGLVETTRVMADGAACEGVLAKTSLLEADGVSVDAVYTCAVVPRRLEVRLGWLPALSRGHRHLARLEGARTEDRVVAAPETSFEVEPRGVVDAAATPAHPAAPGARSFFGFVGMGGEHILSGYDHLAFLLGLLLVPITLRRAAWTVTAFTVAHSATLAIAASGVFVPSQRVTEPLIALSIAYVAVENLVRKSSEHRERLTFVFGLVHGFGFAGALRALALEKGELPRALFGFNLGVELGQLTVMAVLFVGLRVLTRWTRIADRGRTWTNLALAAFGLVLALQRVIYP